MLSYSALIGEDQVKHSLKNALFINDYELNEIGKASLELMDSEILSETHNNFAWFLQSIWEYQDMQGGQVFHNNLWMKQGYCYFESVHILRESILAGINSYFHVSISGLRSSLELLLLHMFWESTKNEKNDLIEFGDWIEGRVSKLPFKRLVSNVNNKFYIPSDWELSNKIEKIYGKLCSYAHTPILKESFTQIKSTNMSYASEEALNYWMKLYVETLSCMLHLLIACYPMSLFPVNIILKYGFSPPMGLFFDNLNTRSLLKSLGVDKWNEYRRCYINNDNNVKNLLDWHDDHPDKSLIQIKKTWNKEEMHTKEYRKLKNIKTLEDPELELLLFLTKMKIRVIQLQFIYK